MLSLYLQNFCNRAAAERITGRKVKRVEEWARVVFVVFESGSPRFMSKNQFQADGVSVRSDRALEAKVVRAESREVAYRVQCPGSPEHIVYPSGDCVTCDCKDYKAQWPKQPRDRICTHIIAARLYMSAEKQMRENPPPYQKYTQTVERELAVNGYSID